jgi:hypothetical protein
VLPLVLFRETDLAGVADCRAGLQVGLADVCQITGGSSEAAGTASDVCGIADESEARLRQRNSGCHGGTEEDLVAGFRNPVMLDVE